MKTITDIEVAKKMINLQQSAISRNIEFDLSFETVKSLLLRTHCFYTGIKFEDDGKLSFSVDRVDSKKGYIEGNVVACTIDINSKKSNLTIDEINLIHQKIQKFIVPAKPKKSKPITKIEKNEEVNNVIEPVSDSQLQWEREMEI
jgi:hypothetical protein